MLSPVRSRLTTPKVSVVSARVDGRTRIVTSQVRSMRFRPQALVRPHASLPLPRVIRRIDVGHPPRANAVRLDDRLALSPIKMASSSRDDDETSGRHRFGGLDVELVAPADVEGAGDHGEVPVGRVEVWWNVVAVGYLQAVRERHVGHRSIALKGGALGSAWNRGGAGLPPQLLRPHQDGRLDYGGR